MGLVRTNNEDNFVICPDLSQNNWFVPRGAGVMDLNDSGCLLVVADGMGGMNAGEVASAIAVETVQQMFGDARLSKVAEREGDIEKFMRKVIVSADSNIKSRVKTDPSTSGMGTTIVMAWAVRGNVYVSWCGDSRAYCYNPQSGLVRLSKDHSYVQQLVDEGKLDPELAFDHPNSNIIMKSLGDSPVKADPDFVKRKLCTSDVILLCSDGLCGLCRDLQIQEVIEASDIDNLDQVKSNLIAAALGEGGHDNVTVALMHCIEVKEDELAKTSNFGVLKPQTPVQSETPAQSEAPVTPEEPGGEESEETKEAEDTNVTKEAEDAKEAKPAEEAAEAQEAVETRKKGLAGKLAIALILIVVLLTAVVAACYFYAPEPARDLIRGYIEPVVTLITNYINTLR